MNTMLMILDGFGINPDPNSSAIERAKKPFIDKLFKEYPNTTISASGLAVGLPEGQMGNSEVGHLNIGAGRVVYQELTRITEDIKNGSFFDNKVLNNAIEHVIKNDSSLHLMGLVSNGGVHSHIEHLFALIDLAKAKGLKQVFIHAFLDGRDVPPRSAYTYLSQLREYIDEAGLGEIATISGRYYAMDRDRRWERVKKAYDALTLGEGRFASSEKDAIEKAYNNNENDEFLLPTVIINDNKPTATINDNDSIIMFNFRPDRARQITRAFVDDTFNGFERTKRPKNLCYICMTEYDAEMPNVQVAYPTQSLKNTLGEYLANLNLRQLRIAETEKYAHVTFFLNGGIEAPFKGEERILIPSPKVATYDLKPEMSAYLITDRVVEIIKEKKYDFIILNYANPDMVGHTGVMEAAVKAIEVLDKCVERVVKALKEAGGQMILTSDHGNADCMFDEHGNTVTAHSLNPVPLLVMSDRPVKLAEGGILADIAPTLLDLANIEKPKEMTGNSLLG